jgi:hypothetical protein
MIIFDDTPKSTETGQHSKSITRRQANIADDLVKVLDGLFASDGTYQTDGRPNNMISGVYKIPQGCTSVTVEGSVKYLSIPQIVYLKNDDTLLQKLLNDEEVSVFETGTTRGISLTLNTEGESVVSTNEPLTINTVKDYGYLVVPCSPRDSVEPTIYFNF